MGLASSSATVRCVLCGSISLIEWLAGPGCFSKSGKQRRPGNHGLLIIRSWNEIDGLLLATFSNHSVSG
jgi:hypothetical protein